MVINEDIIGFLVIIVVWYSANSSSKPSLGLFYLNKEVATNFPTSVIPATALPIVVLAALNVFMSLFLSSSAFYRFSYLTACRI